MYRRNLTTGRRPWYNGGAAGDWPEVGWDKADRPARLQRDDQMKKQTQTTTEAQGTTQAPAGETEVQRLSRLLKEARAAAKSTKASRPCAKQGCKLFAMDELDVCSNHRPALSKLTDPEQTALSTWLEALTPNELLHAYVEAMGWAKAKAYARDLSLTKQ